MHDLLPHFYFFFGIMLSVILFGVVVFSLSAPLEFAKWFAPWFLISRAVSVQVPSQWDKVFSLSLGFSCLVTLMLMNFSLGVFLVQALRFES
jgi:hypothetical protein